MESLYLLSLDSKLEVPESWTKRELRYSGTVPFTALYIVMFSPSLLTERSRSSLSQCNFWNSSAVFHNPSLRKQPTFRGFATWALAKRRLSNERRNSILMTCNYPDQGSRYICLTLLSHLRLRSQSPLIYGLTDYPCLLRVCCSKGLSRKLQK